MLIREGPYIRINTIPFVQISAKMLFELGEFDLV